jgi:hypothetical protein
MSDYAKTIEDLHNTAEPMTRIFGLGMINRCFSNFNNKPLSTLDKRLLKGFYVREKLELQKDIDNEEIVSRKLI